jgi:nucleotide-binding universal stress UspA family protein
MSAQLRRILVAVDFGEASVRALELAAELSRRCGAALSVVHAEALDAPPYFTPAQLDVLEGEAAANRARATEFLRAFAHEHSTAPFDVLVESRTPVDAILHASAGVDLVVMGTHGRRGPSRWWLGSVAERVLRESRAPLLVAHATRTPEATVVFGRGALVEPAEGHASPRTEALAAEIARSAGGEIVRVPGAHVRDVRSRQDAGWLAVPVPHPRSAAWLSAVGEPLVTSCTLPVLFVPEMEVPSS